MNLIYLNEKREYCEAFADVNGRIVIPEKNLICGFVDKGKMLAINDENNDILTPFEVFVQNNDMSMNLVREGHFQQENRVINIEGQTFCEIKQVFSCVPFVSKTTDFKTFFGASAELGTRTIAHKGLESKQVNGVWQKLPLFPSGGFTIERTEGGVLTHQKTFQVDAGKIPVLTAPYDLSNSFIWGAWAEYPEEYGRRYLQNSWGAAGSVTLHTRTLNTMGNQTGAEYTDINLHDLVKEKYQVFDVTKMDLAELAYNSSLAVLDPSAVNPEFFEANKDFQKLELCTVVSNEPIYTGRIRLMTQDEELVYLFHDNFQPKYIKEDQTGLNTFKFYSSVGYLSMSQWFYDVNGVQITTGISITKELV